ncbi:MAG: hypothetical protein WCG90_08235 [Chitinophagia bacterium]
MSTIKFGNLDQDQKYDLSKLNTLGDKYVVRHYGFVELGNGEKMEDPTTNRFQVYDTRTFNDMNRQPEVNGKQGKSKFQAIGLNIDVLHNPELDSEAAGSEGGSQGGAAKKPATEVIKLIKEALSAEEVDQLIVGDERVSVVAAAEKRKAEL